MGEERKVELQHFNQILPVKPQKRTRRMTQKARRTEILILALSFFKKLILFCIWPAYLSLQKL